MTNMQSYKSRRDPSRSPRYNDGQDQWKSETFCPVRVGLNGRKFVIGVLFVFTVGLYTLVFDVVRSLPEKPLILSGNGSWIDRPSSVISDLPFAEDASDVDTIELEDDSEPEIDSVVLDERYTLSWKHRGDIRGNKSCAMVEEMGDVTVGSGEGVESSSLRIRRLIEEHFAVHGAENLRKLPAKQFCAQRFVAETLQQKGLGNCLYKTVTAAGLSMMLGRALILSELNAFNASYDPAEDRFGFQDYISNTKQAFSMHEVQQLWVKHGCSSKFGRPLTIRSYNFSEANRTKELCDDWSEFTDPIIRYLNAEDSIPLQLFLKSRVPSMRARAYRLLGPTNDPNMRPNLFGELLNYIHAPTKAIEEAINWTLGKGGDPDIAVHLRVMHMMDEASETSAWCVSQVLKKFPKLRSKRRKPRVAVVSDTEAAVFIVREALGADYEVVTFDYKAWLKAFPKHKTMNGNKTKVPQRRALDWGPAPRWVGIVDFYLAARARVAVISAARQRVATTFVQLAAAVAAARQLNEKRPSKEPRFMFYSSFQKSLLRPGLLYQSGRSFVWHPFASNLSCPGQKRQCAPTALLPYAWYDAPWQNPSVMMRQWQSMGIPINSEGEITPEAREQFCNRTKDVLLFKDTTLHLPSSF